MNFADFFEWQEIASKGIEKHVEGKHKERLFLASVQGLPALVAADVLRQRVLRSLQSAVMKAQKDAPVSRGSLLREGDGTVTFHPEFTTFISANIHGNSEVVHGDFWQIQVQPHSISRKLCCSVGVKTKGLESNRIFGHFAAVPGPIVFAFKLLKEDGHLYVWLNDKCMPYNYAEMANDVPLYPYLSFRYPVTVTLVHTSSKKNV